jgi:hypothetical protein
MFYNFFEPWIRIRIELKFRIRIRIETNADPQHWLQVIRKTAMFTILNQSFKIVLMDLCLLALGRNCLVEATETFV